MTREEQRAKAAHEYIQSDSVEAGNEVLAFGDFINGAKWADFHPNWISVEEELPPKIEGEEITEYYWVAGLNGVWYDVLRYDYRNGSWSDHYGNYHACVTHWMEIQPSRKEE